LVVIQLVEVRLLKGLGHAIVGESSLDALDQSGVLSELILCDRFVEVDRGATGSGLEPLDHVSFDVCGLFIQEFDNQGLENGVDAVVDVLLVSLAGTVGQ